MPVNNLFEPGGKGLRWGQEEVDREPQSPLLCRSVFPQPPSAHFLYFPWSSLHFGSWAGGGGGGREKQLSKRITLLNSPSMAENTFHSVMRFWE